MSTAQDQLLLAARNRIRALEAELATANKCPYCSEVFPVGSPLVAAHIEVSCEKSPLTAALERARVADIGKDIMRTGLDDARAHIIYLHGLMNAIMDYPSSMTEVEARDAIRGDRAHAGELLKTHAAQLAALLKALKPNNWCDDGGQYESPEEFIDTNGCDLKPGDEFRLDAICAYGMTYRVAENGEDAELVKCHCAAIASPNAAAAELLKRIERYDAAMNLLEKLYYTGKITGELDDEYVQRVRPPKALAPEQATGAEKGEKP